MTTRSSNPNHSQPSERCEYTIHTRVTPAMLRQTVSDSLLARPILAGEQQLSVEEVAAAVDRSRHLEYVYATTPSLTLASAEIRLEPKPAYLSLGHEGACTSQEGTSECTTQHIPVQWRILARPLTEDAQMVLGKTTSICAVHSGQPSLLKVDPSVLPSLPAQQELALWGESMSHTQDSAIRATYPLFMDSVTDVRSDTSGPAETFALSTGEEYWLGTHTATLVGAFWRGGEAQGAECIARFPIVFIAVLEPAKDA